MRWSLEALVEQTNVGRLDPDDFTDEVCFELLEPSNLAELSSMTPDHMRPRLLQRLRDPRFGRACVLHAARLWRFPERAVAAPALVQSLLGTRTPAGLEEDGPAFEEGRLRLLAGRREGQGASSLEPADPH